MISIDSLGDYGAIASLVALVLVTGSMIYKWRAQIGDFLRGSPRVLIGWVTWRSTAALLAFALFVVVFWPPASYFLHDIHKDNERAKELRTQIRNALRTRPTCADDCKNFEWKVNKCLRESLEVGVTSTNRLGDVLTFSILQGTGYFRGCLTNEGLGWESCDFGEEGCVLVDHFGRR